MMTMKLLVSMGVWPCVIAQQKDPVETAHFHTFAAIPAKF